MTERKWLTCKEPWQMLEYLEKRFARVYKRAAKLSSEGEEDPQAAAVWRKLRLYGAACCRRLWHLLEDSRCRQAIETTERNADDPTTAEEVFAAADRIEELVPSDEDRCTGQNQAAKAVWRATYPLIDDFTDARESATEAADAAAYAVYPEPEDPEGEEAGDHYDQWEQITREEEVAQTDLLRDLFGNPFRAVHLDPSWLTSNVTALAQVIYHERRYEDLPILADALEEAGCTNADVLAHCRGPGPHVRGCWLLDLLLAKEWTIDVRPGTRGTRDKPPAKAN